MESLLHNIRVGFRTLVKNPGFSGVAILVLGIGIGANTVLFSLVNVLLLRPPAVEEPERLRSLFSKHTELPDAYRAFSYPNYQDIRDRNDVFTDVTAFDLTLVGLEEGEDTRRVFAATVAANYFRTHGIGLEVGREFASEEERPGAGLPRAVIGYRLWERRGLDPQILGQTVRINGNTYTIVGVAPESYSGPIPILPVEVFLPLGVWESVAGSLSSEQTRPLDQRNNHRLHVLARLRDDLSTEKAETQLQGLAAQMAAEFPEINGEHTLMTTPVSRLSVSTAPSEDDDRILGAVSLLLMGMGSIVLLIACLNLGNLQAAKSATRTQEFAIRMALGGSKGRIVSQLLVEGLLVSLCGGLIGVLFSFFASGMLSGSLAQASGFALNLDAYPDWRVILATLGFCLLSTLFFALRPALKLARRPLFQSLTAQRSSGQQGSLQRGWIRGRNLPVMSQVALSLALLIVAGLFVRGAYEAASIDPGFEIAGATLLETDLSLLGYEEVRSRRLYEQILERFRNHPGVRSAGYTSQIPFGWASSTRTVQRIDRPFSEDRSVDPAAYFNVVSAGYLESIGLPLLDGRAFAPSEEATARAVVIIDRTLAEKLWPGERAVGRRLKLEQDSASGLSDLEVVGVTDETRVDFFSGSGAQSQLFLPSGLRFQQAVHFVVRASSEQAAVALAPELRALALEVDPRLPVLGLRTLENHISQSPSYWLVKTAALIFSSLGLLSLLLAVVGVYGVRAFAVMGRTREIGVRMALGATTQNTIWMVLREGLLILLFGSAVGILLAFGLGQLVSALLYGVQGSDPWAFLAGTGILAIVMLLACYLPARRAARIDPLEALRFE